MDNTIELIRQESIQRGLETFNATEQALKTIMRNWTEYWSYGHDGSPALNQMADAAQAMYVVAKHQLELLQDEKALWKELGKKEIASQNHSHKLVDTSEWTHSHEHL